MGKETKEPRRLWMPFAVTLLVGAVVAPFVLRDGASGNGSWTSGRAPAALVPVEVAFTNLVRVDDRLLVRGESTAFTGTTVEHYPDGALRSRTEVVAGRLEGLSEGWHPNGQRQVSEQFVAGLSQGVRTLWYASGAKLSEAHLAGGELNGWFRRWHENGVLSEEIKFTDGKPDGVSRAWFASGRLKARAVMRQGEIIERQFWPEEAMTQPALDQRLAATTSSTAADGR
ncbi:MAG: toxin-antitoxin system YwqK family antitoxin [Verrucomicrobiales bacterium]|nr:toxin-antitoxin system YwqK family antitoxin [Verrucomicrobiales bacterium]MCP5525872.1 toxin-antitoxin system YwqK family antitoxin [Verrucomicrobiales bacterium]